MKMSEAMAACEDLGFSVEPSPHGLRLGTTGWRLECGSGIAGNSGEWWLKVIAGAYAPGAPDEKAAPIGPARTKSQLRVMLVSKWPRILDRLIATQPPAAPTSEVRELREALRSIERSGCEVRDGYDGCMCNPCIARRALLAGQARPKTTVVQEPSMSSTTENPTSVAPMKERDAERQRAERAEAEVEWLRVVNHDECRRLISGHVDDREKAEAEVAKLRGLLKVGINAVTEHSPSAQTGRDCGCYGCLWLRSVRAALSQEQKP